MKQPKMGKPGKEKVQGLHEKVSIIINENKSIIIISLKESVYFYQIMKIEKLKIFSKDHFFFYYKNRKLSLSQYLEKEII
jgi:hypothetical protein